MKFWPVIQMDFAAAPPAEQWDLFVSRLMSELECLGVEEAGETPLAGAEKLRHAKLFFPAFDCGPEEARFALQSRQAEVEALCTGQFETQPAIKLELLPDEDWGATWRKYFRLVSITNRIFCGPPWDARLPTDVAAGAFVIVIDPGQAFGTGTHETTQLCLRIMESQVKPGSVVFDVGAGSGILSIAAVKLGAQHALGMEYDGVCLENFDLNVELNDVEGRATFLHTGDPAEALRMGAERGIAAPELTVCNMLSVRFMPLLPALRAVGVPTIVSGFLLKENDEIRAELSRVGFAVESAHESGEWGAFVCV